MILFLGLMFVGWMMLVRWIYLLFWFRVSYFLLWIIRLLLGSMLIMVMEIVLFKLLFWLVVVLLEKFWDEFIFNCMDFLLMFIVCLVSLVIGLRLMFEFFVVLVLVDLFVWVFLFNVIVMMLLIFFVVMLEYKLLVSCEWKSELFFIIVLCG